MKKIVNILTATALTAAMSVPVFAASFTDLADSKYDWARDNIEKMAEAGYIKGYDDGTFGPDNNITKLECIALFARAMGATDKANSAILEEAHKQYDDLLKSYYLDWGTDELAYMLYKGALTRSDLDTYIKYVKNEPMSRFEAAIIITKAMGGEDTAKEQSGIALDYADSKDIPTTAIQYVKYVGDQGIMKGMDGNNFAPLDPVLRSQMATMLARVVDKIGYEHIEGKLSVIDPEDKQIVLNVNGKEKTYSFNDATSFSIQGKAVAIDSMITDVTVTVTLSNNVVSSVDAKATTPDQKITGRFQGSSLASNVTFIKLLPTGATKVKEYACAPGLSVLYEGSPASLRSFAIDDLITITLEEGKVTRAEGQQRSQVIANAKITEINLDDQLSMTISHADKTYNGVTYPIANDVSVQKNALKSDMSLLYPGDSVDLTLEYGEITKIVATSSTRSQSGTIQQINIATESSMIVKIDGTDKTFIVPPTVSININGDDGTLYDFRVGDYVTITTESGAITKIVSSGATTQEGKIYGVVTSINTSYGFIKILKEGSDTAETVFCKNSSATFVSSKGSTKTMDSIKVGDTIEARCTLSNGAYTAKLIIIEEK